MDPARGTATAAYVCPQLELEEAASLRFRDSTTSTEMCVIWLGLHCLTHHSDLRKVSIKNGSRSAVVLLTNYDAPDLLALTVANTLRDIEDTAFFFLC